MKRYKTDPFTLKILTFVQRFTNCRKDKYGKYTVPSPVKRQAHILGLTYPLPRGWIKQITETSLTSEQRVEFMQLYKPLKSESLTDKQKTNLKEKKCKQDLIDLKRLANRQKLLRQQIKESI